MARQLINILKKIRISRTIILSLVFILLSTVLLRRLYDIQIVNGEEYRNNFSLETTKTRSIKGARGNIYDRNGVLIAGNELSYSLTLEDNGTYAT
ncbi:MAG: hypothetical protein IKS06_07775, partial [Lachnospiraceae bacterium]|nr:hypothetical protein [Lachnospiraceae bacterium]